MNKFASLAIASFALIIVMSLRAAPPSSPEDGKLQEELKKQFQASADAILKGDFTRFPQEAAEEYVCIDSFGVLRDKAQTLEFIKSAQLETWKIDDVKARLYGTTAVAVCRTTARGRLGGVDVTGQYLATIVLANRDGKWQIVSAQYTRVAKG